MKALILMSKLDGTTHGVNVQHNLILGEMLAFLNLFSKFGLLWFGFLFYFGAFCLFGFWGFFLFCSVSFGK